MPEETKKQEKCLHCGEEITTENQMFTCIDCETDGCPKCIMPHGIGTKCDLCMQTWDDDE